MIQTKTKRKIEILSYQRTTIPAFFTLPQQPGGYLFLSEFVKEWTGEILKSRRYIKVGEVRKVDFWEVKLKINILHLNNYSLNCNFI